MTEWSRSAVQPRRSSTQSRVLVCVVAVVRCGDLSHSAVQASRSRQPTTGAGCRARCRLTRCPATCRGWSAASARRATWARPRAYLQVGDTSRTGPWTRPGDVRRARGASFRRTSRRCGARAECRRRADTARARAAVDGVSSHLQLRHRRRAGAARAQAPPPRGEDAAEASAAHAPPPAGRKNPEIEPRHPCPRAYGRRRPPRCRSTWRYAR